MVIGFGTPRSGTSSLARYLKLHHEFKTRSNKLLSETDYREWFTELSEIVHRTGYTFGDVGYDHINNLDIWLDMDVTRICMFRDQDDFVKSMLNRGPVRAVERVTPQFDLRSDKGCRQYWDWFYDRIFKNEDKFYIIGTESLPVWINKGDYGKPKNN